MLTPPLDRIPQILPQLANTIVVQINKSLDKSFEELDVVLDDIGKLPDDVSCDDPRVKDIEEKLNEVLESINEIQTIIPTVEKVITGVQTLVSAATAAKAAIFLVPVVGVAALQAELMIVQNMTIANAIKSIEQLNIIPGQLDRSITTMSNKLATVVNGLSNICSNKEFAVTDEIQDAIDNKSYNNVPGLGSGNALDPGTGIAWGSKQSRNIDAQLGTEFYNELNVSSEDLESQLDVINKLVADQQDLLTSLQEAPAQSYEGRGIPDSDLGKTGDYYIDQTNKVIYGPKTNSGWPEGVNY
jgi:chaperonin cofactor prefoldin